MCQPLLLSLLNVITSWFTYSSMKVNSVTLGCGQTQTVEDIDISRLWETLIYICHHLLTLDKQNN